MRLKRRLTPCSCIAQIQPDDIDRCCELAVPTSKDVRQESSAATTLKFARPAHLGHIKLSQLFTMLQSRIFIPFVPLLFVLSAAGIGPVTNLSIVDTAVTPDGYTRQAVLPGGTFPGPLITGQMEDNFQINVTDELTNATMLTGTTVHWHGIFQHGTAWADGTAFVTQCPITSGNSFLYNFTVPGQAGTFWYHSHYMTQYCDGLRGPLVIYDPNDPYADLYDVDDENTVITIADWLHTAARLGPEFPTPDSTLINGLGRVNDTASV
ncbi:Laccase [Grifola frondosa]|uniref:laccase n=1 Tax=Grifola frondosa TaxID=5627 RepID=A0A1C7LKJ8_GRIFR|nr:Laccase [Grifola frondosa]